MQWKINNNHFHVNLPQQFFILFYFFDMLLEYLFEIYVKVDMVISKAYKI